VKISGVVITFNEEARIRRCIESLMGICDEVLVIDSHSTDQTVAIALELGARVVQRPFPGHIEQKNFGKNQATHDWVLSLDADEEISEALRRSILLIKEQGPECAGYTFNRLNNYCGQWIRHGNWYPDKKLRLWKRDLGNWKGRNPHDKLELSEGSPCHLSGDLLHYSIESREAHLETIRKYARIAAEALQKEGKGHLAWKRFTSPLGEFLGGYLFRLGFLDGRAGWQIATLSAYAAWLKYHLLKQLIAK
jgi:glycosyltransferase involved in cell wall biosynthesis